MLLPKTLLSLAMGLLTRTVFLGILALWPGVWPGQYLPATWVLAGLVILFWAPLALLVGLHARYFAGMIAMILTRLTVFFVAGGLGLVRANWAAVPWFSELVPNTCTIHPLRDLVRFRTWPADWGRALLILAGFAGLEFSLGWGLAARQLRRAG